MAHEKNPELWMSYLLVEKLYRTLQILARRLGVKKSVMLADNPHPMNPIHDFHDFSLTAAPQVRSLDKHVAADGKDRAASDRSLGRFFHQSTNPNSSDFRKSTFILTGIVKTRRLRGVMTRDQLIEELRKMPYNDEVVLQLDVDVLNEVSGTHYVTSEKQACGTVVPQANTIVLTP